MGGERTACLCGKANVLLGSCTPVSALLCPNALGKGQDRSVEVFLVGYSLV